MKAKLMFIAMVYLMAIATVLLDIFYWRPNG